MRRWRRRQGVLFVPQVRARDDLTDADGTALESHTPTSGGSWTKHSISGLGNITIDGGRAHNPDDATLHLSHHSWVPVSADYAVEVDVVLVTDNNLANAGPAGRIDPDANTYYLLIYNTSGNVWQVFKLVAGAATQLGGNVAQTLTAERPYRARLVMRGTRIAAFVDGVAIIAVNDEAIRAAGRAGLRAQNAASATTGLHLNDWRVRQ